MKIGDSSESCLEGEGETEGQQSPVKTMDVCLVFSSFHGELQPHVHNASHMDWTLIISLTEDVCNHRKKGAKREQVLVQDHLAVSGYIWV